MVPTAHSSRGGLVTQSRGQRRNIQQPIGTIPPDDYGSVATQRKAMSSTCRN